MSQLSLPVIEMLKTVERPTEYRAPDLPSLEGVDEAAVDFETTGLRWWAGDVPVGCAVAWRDPATGDLRDVYVPTRHKDSANVPEDRARAWLVDQMRGKRLAGAGVKFDLHMARVWGADLEGVVREVRDVAHVAALLDDNRRSFSLEAISRDYLGEGKVSGLDLSRGAGVYPAHMVDAYARQDARLVLRNLERMMPAMAEQGLLEVLALEEDCAWATVEMERNGSLIDVDKLHRWLRESEVERHLLNMRLTAAAGFAVNVDSGASVARLCAQRGLRSDAWTETCPECGQTPERGHEKQPKCRRVTRSGGVTRECGADRRESFSADVLGRLALRDPVLGLALQVARLADLRSKYLVPYAQSVGSDGVLRYALHQLRGEDGGTVSGRYSSSKPARDEGCNIQQVVSVDKQLRLHCAACRASWSQGSDAEKIARHYAGHPPIPVIRELFIAPRGRRYAAADADQIEYRVFAHMSNSPRILEAYRKDPHLDYHEMTGAIVKEYRADFERKRVKNCNFAVLFGAGIEQMAEMLGGVTAEEAEDILDAYDAALPEARSLMREAMQVAKTRGFVRTISGRRARFPTGQRLHSALNRAVQGSAGDINKKKLARLYRERKRLGLTLRITNHDEAACDLPDDAAAGEMGRVLDVQEYPLRVPITWTVKVGANWAECK